MALQTFAVILATGGEPKVPQLKDATKAMSLEVTFQKDSRHSWGLGLQGGMGEEAPWFGKMKVIGYWNCRMGCFFFGLIGLIGVFLFLLKWDSCSLWLWRKYKILGVLIEWWVRKATDEVFIAELPSLKLAVGGVNGDFELWVTFLLYTFLIFFKSCFWVSLPIMDKPKWMIQKLWISNNQNFAVALVP